MLNRFVVQAVAGVPLTVYGSGDQTRGYLNLRDTLQCIGLAAAHPAGAGRIAHLQPIHRDLHRQPACRAGPRSGGRPRDPRRHPIDPNPRKEKEEHYYNPKFTGLKALGLEPHLLTDDVLGAMIEEVARHKDRIRTERIFPRVRWS